MNTYLFTFTIEPTNNSWWDTRKNVPVRVKADNLKAAKDKFLSVLEDEYYFEISKTAKKKPSIMYTEYKDGSSKKTGYVWKASTEIEWNEKIHWKKVYANIWTSIELINNPFEA